MAWYKSGTVTVTNGSPVVTGANTDFVANVQIGHAFVAPDGRTYEIAAIDAAGQLRLASLYLGGSVAGAAYAIQPTSSLTRDLTGQVAALINSFAAVRDGIGIGLISDGSTAAPGLRFSADQDTGIARLGSNYWGLIAGGVVGGAVTSKGIFALASPGSSVGFSIESERFTPASGAEIARYGLSMSPYAGEFGVGLSAFGPLNFFTNGALRWRVDTGGHFQPAVDAAFNIGSTPSRVNVVYAASGAINTSDQRTKQWRGDLTGAELAAADQIATTIGVYQDIDAIDAKGADKARLHVGVQAQAVAAIFDHHGLDAMRYGIVCYDEWPEIAAPIEQRDAHGALIQPATPPAAPQRAGNRYGIRYEELSMFLLRAERQRRDALEDTLATLSGQVSMLGTQIEALISKAA